jgi:plasmid stabilization system protein ParE
VTYSVLESDQAQAEREATFLRLGRIVGPEYAQQWHDGLLLAIAELAGFPGPRAHATDEGASARYGVEVRRMLYFGPGRRRSGTPYRVLFTVIPSADDEEEAIIRVLRVLHGAQQPPGQAEEDQEP